MGRRGLGRAAPLFLLLFAGCWVPLERGRVMEDRLDKLESASSDQKTKLEEEQVLFKNRVAKADQKIAEVQAKLDELNTVARRSGADLDVSVDKLKEDVAKLGGDLEAQDHRQNEFDQSLTTLRADLDRALAIMKGAGALDAYDARQKLAALKNPEDRQAVLALAQSEESSGNKGVAREVYQEFMRRWPLDPLAAGAGMRVGDFDMDLHRYREALLAYGKVAQDFPDSAEAPSALLGAADAMLNIDMKDDAEKTLKQLIARYPKSRAAPKARARLAQLEPSRRSARKR